MNHRTNDYRLTLVAALLITIALNTLVTVALIYGIMQYVGCAP
jgi:hypothetical protein